MTQHMIDRKMELLNLKGLILRHNHSHNPAFAEKQIPRSLIRGIIQSLNRGLNLFSGLILDIALTAQHARNGPYSYIRMLCNILNCNHNT